MELIDKSALVAEIEKTEKISKDASEKAVDTYFKIHFDGWVTACRSILSFLDTLEVKEVDLEKEIQQHINDCLDVKFPTTDVELIKKDVAYTARKFFELGLSVNIKAQKGE